MTTYRYGYARISTAEQTAQLHLDALTAAGIDPTRVFHELASTPPPPGRLLFGILAFLAAFVRDRVRERTNAACPPRGHAAGSVAGHRS